MRHQPGDRIDQYEIIEGLGEGAYAEAYKARDTTGDRIVMIKSPNPLLFGDPQIYQRFVREAEIAQRLHHPGVQSSLDIRKASGQPYLVLEFIEGVTLRKREREIEGGVPVELAEDWARQLAETLAYLHSQGVVHRDLKPENILIRDDGVLKIVDFGTAMLTGARRLTWRHLSDGVGTPDYMSPEQIQGDRGDARSDIYAWGVMVYEFLTGVVPFEGDNWLAVMAGHLQRAPRPIHEVRPDVPRTLEAVVLKAMRRYPEHRYQSADDLVADLSDVDALDLSKFDFSPEKPMGGGLATAEDPMQLWGRIGLIALGFIALVVIVILLSVVFHR